MARGCTPGLLRRWSWWAGWDEDNGYRDPPEVDDIAVHPDTGSCYRVVSIKPSPRKATGWYVMHVEGLGVAAASLDDEGTFAYGGLSHADHEMIRLVEQIERERAAA